MYTVLFWPSANKLNVQSVGDAIMSKDLSVLNSDDSVVTFRDALLAAHPNFNDAVFPEVINGPLQVPLDRFVGLETSAAWIDSNLESIVALMFTHDMVGFDPEAGIRIDGEVIESARGPVKRLASRADKSKKLGLADLKPTPQILSAVWASRNGESAVPDLLRQILRGNMESFDRDGRIESMRRQVEEEYPEFRLSPSKASVASDRYLLIAVPPPMSHDPVDYRLKTMAGDHGLTYVKFWDHTHKSLLGSWISVTVQKSNRWHENYRHDGHFKSRWDTYWDHRGEVDPWA